MSKYRDQLPQLEGERLVTDGGIETTLVFREEIDLPLFAAFPLLDSEEGATTLRTAFTPYVEVARNRGLGVLIETPTWRASPGWAAQLGYSLSELVRLNHAAVELLVSLRAQYPEVSPFVISGCIGPQDDGYSPSSTLSADEAQAYHASQIGAFRDSEADLVSAFTLTYADEAVGITRAAREAGMPVVISFTVETDGRLPSAQPLADAIAEVDEQTGGGPEYYMVNCAHPTHFEHVLTPDAPWLERIGGLRANASRKSHAELDESTELDDGDPAELGAQHGELVERLPGVRVLGGCCGTDHRHVDAIAGAWLSAAVS